MKTLREEHRAPVGELDSSFRGVPDPFKKCALGISTLLVSTSTLRDVELRHDQKELWASHGFAVQRIKGIKRCYIFFILLVYRVKGLNFYRCRRYWRSGAKSRQRQ
jgi:hypothetical protein